MIEKVRNPSVPTFFTNRALCYLKLQQWDSSCQDCRRALDMEPNLIKGHFFLGQALLETEHFDDAIKHLQRGIQINTNLLNIKNTLNIIQRKAHDLAKDQKLNFGDEIAYQLRVARKKRWNSLEEKRIKEEIELQTYLNTLIQLDKEQQLNKLKTEMQNNTITDEQTIKELKRMIITTSDQRISDLNSMFSALDIRRKVSIKNN